MLSGFLITSLLLTEHRGRDAIDLGRFWARRARRLLPALFLVVVGIGVLLWFTPEAERAGFRGDGLSMLYAANWNAMVDSASYWEMFGQPSPFDHMWSLAIEWLLPLVGAHRRRAGDRPGRRGRAWLGPRPLDPAQRSSVRRTAVSTASAVTVDRWR